MVRSFLNPLRGARFARVLAFVAILAVQLACGLPAQAGETRTPEAQIATPQPSSTTLSPAPSEQEATPPTQTNPPGWTSPTTLKNFGYWMEDYKIHAAHLDGAYSDEHIQSRVIEPLAFGDLTGDGQEDAAVILAVKTGGTGTFYYLIALLDQDGVPVQADTTYIGDRQGLKNLTIQNGRIVMDYITQGLKDPLCCASEHRLRSYVLDFGKLYLASEQVLDSPDAQAAPLPNSILVDSPVDGDKLVFPLRVSGRAGQVPPEGKLSYYLTDLNATLLDQGEIPIVGQAGGPGSFSFELNLDNPAPSLYQLEIVDAASGILRGRTVVLLTSP